MTLQEINNYLNRRYMAVDQEDFDGEQQYYNNNISNIQLAIKYGFLNPENVLEEQLNHWINDGIDDDLKYRIESRYKKTEKKSPELRFKSVEEILDYLEKTDFRQHPEETDQEEGTRVCNIIDIKYALKNGFLLPQELTEELLTDYVVDGLDSDLQKKIDDLMMKEAEREEEEKKEEKEFLQPVPETQKKDDQIPIEEELPGFLEEAAKVSILPQKADVIKSWTAQIKNFLKEKFAATKNFIKDMFERTGEKNE